MGIFIIPSQKGAENAVFSTFSTVLSTMIKFIQYVIGMNLKVKAAEIKGCPKQKSYFVFYLNFCLVDNSLVVFIGEECARVADFNPLYCGDFFLLRNEFIAFCLG